MERLGGIDSLACPFIRKVFLVPIPVLFVFIMIIDGATLSVSGGGIKMYFSGKAAFCSADAEKC